MDSNNNILISVIIPVYNVDKFLHRCVDSIIAQTYKNFEIILIDDGSDDSSGLICDDYAFKYKNIDVYHQKNQGVVSAREKGIYSAKGKYLSFIDADDWVESYFLQSLIENIEKYNADIVIEGYCKDIKEKNRKVKNHIEAGIYEAETRALFYKEMLQCNTFYEFGVEPFLWNKLFKRDLFIDCMEGMDDKISEAEDAALVFPYLLHSNRIVVTGDCLYHYVYRKSSVTNERKFNYFDNISRLFLYLNRKFQETDYYDIMLPQLAPYMRMLVYIENPDAFVQEGKYIFPFRKIPVDSQIVLYGAGHIGKIYQHQVKLSKYCHVAAWVDASYSREDLRQLDVKPPHAIEELEYDFIVIAIENKEVVCTVKKMLLDMGVSEPKIVFADEL